MMTSIDASDVVLNTPTIYLVDNDPTTRETIGEIAQSMRANLRCFENGESFLQSYTPQGHGCVVSEFRLRGMNGISLQESLKKKGHSVPIVFVTAFAETPLTVRAVKAGAIKVLEKPYSRQDLWDALQNAFAMQDQFLRVDAKHAQIKQRLATLTPKERQVLDLIIAGRPNKTIANELSVSVRTVEARRHQIFKKAGAESVAELVKIIIESGELNHE